MKPEKSDHYSVKARCPNCSGAISVFDHRPGGHDLGSIVVDERHVYNGVQYGRVLWSLVRCSGCGRGGLAKFHDNGNSNSSLLESFHPRALSSAQLPAEVPEGVRREFREAELCASVEAWRAASALLRSVLEKALRANGYVRGSLQQKIDDAASDGVITSARKQKAHDDIRVLGNEVVHDEWRAVLEDEVSSALHYVQRVLEDLYDDRKSVEAILRANGRLTI